MPNQYSDPKTKSNNLDIFGNPMTFNIDLPVDHSKDLTPWEKINRWATVDTSKFKRLTPRLPDDFIDRWDENS